MPAVPTPPTIRDEVTPSSKFNQFRDAINFLQRPPTAHLRQTSAQTLSNNTWTSLTWDTEDVDTDVADLGGHSASNAEWTAQYSGWYLIAGTVTFVTNATGIRATRWLVNGNVASAGQTTLGAVDAVPARTRLLYLEATDAVVLQAFQSSGGNLDTRSASSAEHQAGMTIKWVSI